jgi:hypothetical protein
MTDEAITLTFLFVWTIGTIILATLVSLAMRHTHHVYLSESDEVFDKGTGHIERCTWMRLYGISLLTVGLGLVLSHSLIESPSIRNIMLGWGILISTLGAGLWLRFSLVNRKH